MDLWHIMLSRVSEAIFPRQIDDAALLKEITTAQNEIKAILSGEDHYIDPIQIKEYQTKWTSLHQHLKKQMSGLAYLLGLHGHSIKKPAKDFCTAFDSFPTQCNECNTEFVNHRRRSAFEIICPTEGRNLDSQQLACIIKEPHSHLVLAGAGTGKTTTIVGYVKYLLKTRRCSAEDILVLSFTNASASEMSTRLAAEVGFSIHASTFHKLGLDIITAVQGKRPKIFSGDIRRYIRGELDKLIQDRAYLIKLVTYLTFNSVSQKSEFDFESEEAFDQYLRGTPPITLRKETVKSYGEMDIANFLFQNGVSYIYEAEYPVDTRTEEYGQYYPDFYLPDYDIYIEYYGINRNGDVPSYFTSRHGRSPRQEYHDSIAWKRQLHKQNHTKLIEVFAYEKQEETLLDSLSRQLSAAGVVFSPLSPEEMWEQICGKSNQQLDRLAELFGTVISLTKSNDCSIEDIRDRNRGFHNLRGIHLVLDLVEPIFDSYQNMLKATGEIDFNDMINHASRLVTDGSYQHSFRFVVIDEYQDISQSRYRLLAALREQKDYRLFCVGDDWQSIYRFSGSDIGFILNFEKYWGPSEISKIETTYRFPQSLIEVSGSFIMQNPDQKVKHLRSENLEQYFAVEKITGVNEKYAAGYMSERLDDLPQGSTVLFLGRYRFDIRLLDANAAYSYRFNRETGKIEVRYRNRPDLQMQFMTIHSSKGLQADYVFILNNKARGMGFPSQIANAPVFELLLDNCDHYPFAEERRLFYVAITRAKKKVWLVLMKNNLSVFAQELEQSYGREMLREQYRCPLCGGQLVRCKGQHGEFYGCSNFRNTGCRYTKQIHHNTSSNT